VPYLIFDISKYIVYLKNKNNNENNI
jgi:hypothetical protein